MATICINWAIAYSLQRMWSPRNVNGMGFEARGLDCQLPTFPFIHYFPLCALISSMTFFFPLPFALSTGTMFMSFVGFPEFLLMSQTPKTAWEPPLPHNAGDFPPREITLKYPRGCLRLPKRVWVTASASGLRVHLQPLLGTYPSSGFTIAWGSLELCLQFSF